MTPTFSCLCMTHGRPWWLVEALESFKRQQLGQHTAELIIVNDCQEQTLACDLPCVYIFQGMPQYTDLSAKYDFAARQARGQWLAFWDDDDIHLPRHLAWTLAQLPRKPEAMAIRPLSVWHWSNGTIRGRAGATLCQAIVRRDAWLQIGGPSVGGWIDKSLALKLRALNGMLDIPQRGEDIHYIYRWGGIGHHDSGSGIEDAALRAERFHAEALADKRFVAGKVQLVPAWAQDYEFMVRRALMNKLDNVRV